MDIADVVMLAEDGHAARMERKESARDAVKAALAGEYLAAATLPLITTVSTPGNSRTRVPFLESFTDDIADWPIAARVVAILARDKDGKALLEELAEKHAEYFCDEVAQ